MNTNTTEVQHGPIITIDHQALYHFLDNNQAGLFLVLFLCTFFICSCVSLILCCICCKFHRINSQSKKGPALSPQSLLAAGNKKASSAELRPLVRNGRGIV